MINISWKVERLDCSPQQGNLANVVNVVHWRCNGVDGNHIGTCYGSLRLDLPDVSSFVAFESLTENLVLEWIKTKLGDEVVGIEASVTAQIAEAKTPTVINPPLPWI